MDKATALLHAARGAQGDQNSLLAALRAALLGDGIATFAGNPNGNVTPANVGERLLDTTNVVFYRASTTGNSAWEVDGAPGITAEEFSSLHYATVCEQFDDFTGPNLSNSWGTKVGSDGSCFVGIQSNTVGLSGTVRLAGGAVATTALAINGAQFQGSLNWEADKGGLAFEARFQGFDTFTNAQAFIGLGDQVALLTMPLSVKPGAAIGLTTRTASDAVGFMFNDLATTSAKDWFMGGVKATVKTTALAANARPQSGTYQIFRIEVSATGTATFYINGVNKGSVANAVTPSTPLAPVVTICSQIATTKRFDLDYIKVRQLR